MIVGLIIRVSPGMMIQSMVSFKYSVFFNFLLPPIILNSGYELHQVKLLARCELISGKLFQEYMEYFDFCLCWDIYLCYGRWITSLAMDENRTRIIVGIVPSHRFTTRRNSIRHGSCHRHRNIHYL